MKNKSAKLFMTTLIAGSISAVVAKSPNNLNNLTLNKVNNPAQAEAPNGETRYIVKFKDNSPMTVMTNGQAKISDEADRLMMKHGARTVLKMPNSGAIAAVLSPKAKAALQNNPNVEYLEIDPVRFAPEVFSTADTPSPMAQSTPYGINMVEALQVPEAGGSMKVCITDTGYDINHEDLISSGVTGDNNSTTGYWGSDGNGHGTHVAGTISALDNGDGVIGVNRNGSLDLHIVKVFGNNGSWGYGSDLVLAINQCVNSGAKVISMSLGGGGSSNTERNAFASALNNGVLSIAAAGNGGNTSFSYPASYDEVVSVAAVNSSGSLASFSQRNSQVEISGPGVSVNSTWTGGGYRSISGTSMATPHVSGVAALVWRHYPQCSATQIRSALNATAEDRGSSGRDNSYGWGIVKAKAAYDYLAGGCDGGGTPPPPPPPPGDGALTNGEAETNISGAQGSEVFYTLEVPAGATDLSFVMSGGSGDADMYVRFGSKPTTSSYDCRPYRNGNNETCDISNVRAGTYYVMIRGYSAYSGTSLVGSFTADDGGGNPPGGEPIDVVAENLSVGSREWIRYTYDLPEGYSTMTVSISGGSGDADLYVNFGSESTTSNYDCRPYRNGNNETCTFQNPQSGTWHLDVRGYRAASGFTLRLQAE